MITAIFYYLLLSKMKLPEPQSTPLSDLPVVCLLKRAFFVSIQLVITTENSQVAQFVKSMNFCNNSSCETVYMLIMVLFFACVITYLAFS